MTETETTIMPITWQCKAFGALAAKELYQLLQLRVAVFVLEQRCFYAELDGKDEASLHMLGLLPTGDIAAYARILPPGVSYPEVSIGRVVSSQAVRGTGAGHQLMAQVMRQVRETYGLVPVRISAQHYLERFYQKFGFASVGDIYVEDDIPHIEMLYRPLT